MVKTVRSLRIGEVPNIACPKVHSFQFMRATSALSSVEGLPPHTLHHLNATAPLIIISVSPWLFPSPNKVFEPVQGTIYLE